MVGAVTVAAWSGMARWLFEVGPCPVRRRRADRHVTDADLASRHRHSEQV